MKIIVKDLDRALKRLNSYTKDKFLDLRKHEFYESKAQIKRKKRAAAIKREKQRQKAQRNKRWGEEEKAAI